MFGSVANVFGATATPRRPLRRITMKTRTDPFFLMAGLYLTVGLLAVVGVVGVDLGVLEPFARLRWVTIHLVTIGAMTQALFGALPALVGSAVDRGEAAGGDAPTRWAQWLA